MRSNSTQSSISSSVADGAVPAAKPARRHATAGPATTRTWAIGRQQMRMGQCQAVGGIGTGLLGTSVATETCGQVRVLKFRKTCCEYWI